MKQESYNDTSKHSLAGTDQEVDFIISTLSLPPGSEILDLHCGYGRHAIELAKQGFRVTGIDATPEILDFAIQRAATETVAIQFLLCNMRDVDYFQQFDAVINMFAAFGYFSDEENGDVMKRVAASLRPGGYLLIDLLNREWMVNNNLNRYWRHPNGDFVLSYKVELKQGIVTMKRVLTNILTDKKINCEFVLRTYLLSEVVTLLEKYGMKVKETFGGFDGRAYATEAPRMIILAQKT
jgi:SAM-dependent methyltransferase